MTTRAHFIAATAITAIMKFGNYIPNATAFIADGKLKCIQAQNIIVLYDFMGNVMKIEIQ
jgi:hypothetical protein